MYMTCPKCEGSKTVMEGIWTGPGADTGKVKCFHCGLVLEYYGFSENLGCGSTQTEEILTRLSDTMKSLEYKMNNNIAQIEIMKNKVHHEMDLLKKLSVTVETLKKITTHIEEVK